MIHDEFICYRKQSIDRHQYQIQVWRGRAIAEAVSLTASQPLSFPIWQMWRLCTYAISNWDIRDLKLGVFQTVSQLSLLYLKYSDLWLVRMGTWSCVAVSSTVAWVRIHNNNNQQGLQVQVCKCVSALGKGFFLWIEDFGLHQGSLSFLLRSKMYLSWISPLSLFQLRHVLLQLQLNFSLAGLFIKEATPAVDWDPLLDHKRAQSTSDITSVNVLHNQDKQLRWEWLLCMSLSLTSDVQAPQGPKIATEVICTLRLRCDQVVTTEPSLPLSVFRKCAELMTILGNCADVVACT
jgi:hypothetical protein